MKWLAALPVLTGCFSVSGAGVVQTALTDSPTRAVGATVAVGTLVEIVEDRAVGQLLYANELGGLAKSNAMRTLGARVVTTNRGLRPGYYVGAAYGKGDPETQPASDLLTIGAGVAYARMQQSVRGRAFTGAMVGVVYRRQQQVGLDQGEVGQFLGVELAFTVGFDLFGPMFARDDD